MHKADKLYIAIKKEREQLMDKIDGLERALEERPVKEVVQECDCDEHIENLRDRISKLVTKNQQLEQKIQKAQNLIP